MRSGTIKHLQGCFEVGGVADRDVGSYFVQPLLHLCLQQRTHPQQAVLAQELVSCTKAGNAGRQSHMDSPESRLQTD